MYHSFASNRLNSSKEIFSRRESCREPVQLDCKGLWDDNPHLYHYFSSMIGREQRLNGCKLPDVVLQSKVWANIVKRLMKNQPQVRQTHTASRLLGNFRILVRYVLCEILDLTDMVCRITLTTSFPWILLI